MSKELQELLERAKATDISVEERSKLIEEIEVLRKKEDEQRQFDMIERLSKGLKFNEQGDIDRSAKNIYDTEEYRSAWAEGVFKGDMSKVERILATDSAAGTTGELLVPKVYLNKIEDAIKIGGRILNKCNIINVRGVVHIPLIKSKTDPKFHKEINADKTGNKKQEKTVTFGEMMLNPEYLAETFEVTKKFEALSLPIFENWLMNELPDALLRVIDAAIILGSTAIGTNIAAGNGLKGVVTYDAATVASIETAGDFDVMAIHAKARGALADGGQGLNLAWAMNSETYFSQVDGALIDGKPATQIVYENGLPQMLYRGVPVVFVDALPSFDSAAAGKEIAVLGNWKSYTVNFPEGQAPIFERNPYARFDENIIQYKSEILVAGGVTRTKAFVVVKKTAPAAP